MKRLAVSNPVRKLPISLAGPNPLFDSTTSRLPRDGEDPYTRLYPWPVVHEMNDEYVLIMDAPGMQKSDFAISCGGGRLIVTGRMTPSEQTGVRNEKWNHEFTRTFTLPETAEVQRIWAEVDDNELAVHVPKREQVHARRVAVK